MKKSIPFLLFFGLSMLDFACTPAPKNSQGEESVATDSSREVNTKQEMEEITVPVGKDTLFLLPESEDGSYNWYYEVSEDWIISMTEPYDYPAKSGGTTPGSPSEEPAMKKFNIKGLKPGEVTIRFYLGRLGEPNTSPPSEKHLRVIVE